MEPDGMAHTYIHTHTSLSLSRNDLSRNDLSLETTSLSKRPLSRNDLSLSLSLPLPLPLVNALVRMHTAYRLYLYV